MHGGQALLLIFGVLLVVNIPTLVFGLLATKCALYLCPSVKRFFFVRWILPVIVGVALMLFGVGVGLVHLQQPWPTRPYLSAWGCVGVMCVADLGLLLLWPWLRYRAHKNRSGVAAAWAGEDSWLSTAGKTSPKVIQDAECPQPAARAPLAAFREGFASPWTGWTYMRQHPGLWRYAVMPLVVNLLVMGLLLAVLAVLARYFVVALHPKFSDDWFGRTLELLVVLAVLIGGLGLSMALWTALQGIFCGHYYAKLAEQVELRLGIRSEDIHEVAFASQVGDTLRDAGFLASVNAGFLLLHLVPGIGSIIAAGGSYYFTCMTLGLDYFEYPLALRGKRRQEMRDFARRHRAHTLGLGTGVAVVSLIPLVNAVLLTTLVTGAVLLHRRLALEEPPCDCEQ